MIVSAAAMIATRLGATLLSVVRVCNRKPTGVLKLE
jgi:hypothetical protein